MQYDWPGNIGELGATVERAAHQHLAELGRAGNKEEEEKEGAVALSGEVPDHLVWFGAKVRMSREREGLPTH